jgi:TetR/AcrR family transcriptional repressor of mexJK operon
MPISTRKQTSTPTPEIDPRTEQVVHRLLGAATQLFMEKGYEGTSMREIAARAHASKETFYRHFPTKDDLFRAVVLQRAEMVVQGMDTIFDERHPPRKALTAFGELILNRMTAKDSIAFHRVLGMARERFPDLLQLYRSTGPFRVRDAMTVYLKHQIKAGRLRKMNAEVGARQFFDLCAAEMLMKAHFEKQSNPPQAAIRKRVKEAVDCFLHGYSE